VKLPGKNDKKCENNVRIAENSAEIQSRYFPLQAWGVTIVLSCSLGKISGRKLTLRQCPAIFLLNPTGRNEFLPFAQILFLLVSDVRTVRA
jgi:hypothetical protein